MTIQDREDADQIVRQKYLDTVANMSDMKLAEIRRLAEIQKATGSLHVYSMIVSGIN